MSRLSRLAPLVLAVPLLAIPSPDARAVVGTDTFAFSGCDREKNYFPFGSETTLTTPITIDTPSPVPVYSDQTVQVTLGTVPGGTFPDDLGETDLGVNLTFEDGRGYTFDVFVDRPLMSFDASEPLVLGTMERDDLRYPDSGFYEFKPKSVQVSLYGYSTGGEGLDYYTLTCDQVPAPSSIVTVGAYDPDADAEIAVDRSAARQGGAFVVSGTDFAHESPDDPDADVVVTLGGVVVGSFDVDETGAFRGVARVPEFAKPGAAVAVRATSAGESATSTVKVSVKKGVAKATPGTVKPGKKVTVKGAAFKPGEKVKVTLKTTRGQGRRLFGKQVTVKADGTFTAAVTLKKAATGRWKVTVNGPKSHRSAKASFRVR